MTKQTIVTPPSFLTQFGDVRFLLSLDHLMQETCFLEKMSTPNRADLTKMGTLEVALISFQNVFLRRDANSQNGLQQFEG